MQINERKFLKRKRELISDAKESLLENSFYLGYMQTDFEECQNDFMAYIAAVGNSDGRFNWTNLYKLSENHLSISQIMSLAGDEQETSHLAYAALYGYWWLKLGPQITAVYHSPEKSSSDIWLLHACQQIALLLITGHADKAAEVLRITAPELQTPYLNGGLDWWVHPWFLLTLFCRWQGIALDTTDCDTPPDLQVYDKVLAHWNTTDVVKVQQLLNSMADYHVATSKEDMGEDDTHEFADSIFWFFPYEILAWLRIREIMGLPNPDTFEHILLQQPQALMPEEYIPFPEDPLLLQVVDKLIKEHPVKK